MRVDLHYYNALFQSKTVILDPFFGELEFSTKISDIFIKKDIDGVQNCWMKQQQNLADNSKA